MPARTKFALGRDHALVVVPNGLDIPKRTGTEELPSSALEVGIASTEALLYRKDFSNALAA